MKKFVLSIMAVTLFSILSTAQCLDPTAFAAGGITSESADLTWTAGDTETEWQVIWGLENFDPAVPAEVLGDQSVTPDPEYQITGLDAETAYDAYVRAVCDPVTPVESGWVLVQFTTLESCPAPTAVTASNLTDMTADLTWTAGDAETEWQVRWVLDGDDPLVPADVIGDETVTPDAEYTITDLDPETAYDAYVRAFCGAGDESDWVLVEFTTTATPCAVPTDVVASNETETTVDLSWTAGDAETEWEVIWGLEDFDPAVPAEIIDDSLVETDPELTIEGLEDGTSYDAYIRAVCGAGDESEWVLVQFTTVQSPILWEDNFDDEATWTIDNGGITGEEYGWGIRSTPAGWTLPAINSTSGGNFAELSNGDPTSGTGTQEVGVTYTMTTATAIDVAALGGSDQITLEFEQYGAKFNDLQQVLISTDGTVFEAVYDNAERETLTADGGDPYDNAELIRVNLAPFLDAVPTELSIQFLWTSNFPAETNPNAWVTYGWMIDDVRIVDNFEYDLEVTASSWGTEGAGGLLSYHRIPTAQVAPIDFNATLRNAGKSEQTGVTYSIDVNNGETVETTAETDLLNLEEAELSLAYTPSGNGTYTISRSVSSDSIAIDGDVTNNEFEDISITVNDFVYARDNGSVNGSITNLDVGTEIGNLYEIHSTANLTGLDIRLNGGANGTAAGTEVFVKLYRAAEDFEFIAESSPIQLANNQLNTFITIPFNDPIEVEAGEVYLAVVGSFDGGLVVSGAGTAVDQTVFLFDYESGDWFFVQTVAMVRMNFDPVVSTAEVEASLGNLNIYPNPTSENATIDFELMNDTDVEVIVTDISGKVMSTQNLGRLNGGKQSANVDASAYANGIYFVTVKTDNTKTTQKFVKK